MALIIYTHWGNSIACQSLTGTATYDFVWIMQRLVVTKNSWLRSFLLLPLSLSSLRRPPSVWIIDIQCSALSVSSLNRRMHFYYVSTPLRVSSWKVLALLSGDPASPLYLYRGIDFCPKEFSSHVSFERAQQFCWYSLSPPPSPPPFAIHHPHIPRGSHARANTYTYTFVIYI